MAISWTVPAFFWHYPSNRVYEHCPFCMRVRMVIGVKKIPVELEVLSNENEVDPIRMVGAKQVPILEYEVDGTKKYMTESLNIAKYLDANYGEPNAFAAATDREDLKEWLDDTSDIRPKLILPRNVPAGFAEYKSEAAVAYWTAKKEAYKGPFAENLAKTNELLAALKPHLEKLSEMIKSEDGKSGVNGHAKLDFDDVTFAPFLIVLTVVKGLDALLPEKVKNYLEYVSTTANVPLFYSKAN